MMRLCGMKTLTKRLANTICQTITQQKKGLLMKRKVLHGLILSGLLSFSLAYPLSSNAQTSEVVTGTETTGNLLPGMTGFTTSGATKSQKAGSGCTTTAFCTGGQQGPGGSFTSTFDLSGNMEQSSINRGFDMDYSVDVKSHISNSTLDSCVGGNVMQGNDCRDIFKLTVTLFDHNTVQHTFEHEVELDFTGLRNFAYSQSIPENEFSMLTGEFEMFGIDAGFPSKFFGPQFSNPTLTTTFDLVTLIETEIIDIIAPIVDDIQLPPDTSITEVSIEVAPPTEIASLEIQVETEIETQLELPSMNVSTPQTEVTVEVADVSSELEMEMEIEPTASEPVQSTRSESTESESGTNNEASSSEGSESTTEGEAENQEGESQGDVDENNTSEESQETETANNSESEEDSDSDAGPDKVDNSKKTNASSNKRTDKDKSSKEDVKKTSKQAAAKKILSKMGDKGKYDSTNQLKTLIVMNVLGNQKAFIDPTKIIPDTPGFFTDNSIPDSSLSDNNYTSYFLFGGDDVNHNALIDSQYRD